VATATTHHYATVNPYTGEVVLEFDSLDAAAVDRAVETAHRAFGAWRDRPIEERAAIVHGAGELLAEQRPARGARHAGDGQADRRGA
jgi:acyl-CoA reductase-like NAD-dependent aldehyde dehydrogenase